jgi:hypothetical protein
VGVADAETDLAPLETAAEAAAALVVSLETPQAQVLLDKATTAAQTAPKAFLSVAAAVVVVAALAKTAAQVQAMAATEPPISASTMRAAAAADAEQLPAEARADLPLAAMAEMEHRQRVQTRRRLIVVQEVAVRVVRQPALRQAELVQTA